MKLPKATDYNKRIPKTKFYEHLKIKPDIKRMFVDQIGTIIWSNKLSTRTLNVDAGERVGEIDIITILLNKKNLDERVLRTMDEGILHQTLFMLRFENDIRYCIGFKEIVSEKSNILKYYQTEWLSEDEITLNIIGLNMDDIYDNFVRQIAGPTLNITGGSKDLKQLIENKEEIEKIKKQITSLERKRNNEKQFNLQFETNSQIKELRELLEELEAEVE